MKTARKIAFELINDWQIPGELEDISVLEKRIELAITEAVQTEREACAGVGESFENASRVRLADGAYAAADLIRARTPAKGDGK